MKHKINTVFKNILCLFIGILISLTQLQFFEDAEIFSITFIVILAITVPTIFLYFIPKHDTIIIFIYNIILIYLLEYLGKSINIELFLITFFSIILLFTYSLYTANTIKTQSKNPSYLIYVLILLILLFVVSIISVYIYKNILKTNIDENNKVSFISKSYENIEIKNYNINKEQISLGGKSSSVDYKKILKNFILFIIIITTIYLLYKIIRYKLWLHNIFSLSKKNQIKEFYRYTLISLSIIRMGKKLNETPKEYLKKINFEEFPFDKEEFIELTKNYIDVIYGEKELNEEVYNKSRKFFLEIPKSLRENLGIKKYVKDYLFKIKI